MELPNGLIRGHAYSITSVRLVDIETPRISGKIPLLRIRNPWGNACEWNGPWSDKSREWSLVSDEEKEELGLNFEHDGEFWISYKDYVPNFSRMEICNLNPDSLEEEALTEGSHKKWEVSMFEGAWVKGISAGGCRNFLETFWMNPQYRITLEDVDDDDDEELCTVIIALMQKNHRAKRKMGQECLTIGFALYKIPEDAPKPLPMSFFKYNQSVARSPSFINLREVSHRFKLPPGTYCIIPSTFDPGEAGDFVLRVFTEKKNEMSEYDEEISMEEPAEEMQQTTEEDASKENAVNDFFAKLAGEDLEIDCFELQEILNFALKKEFEFEGFSIDVCRSMIAMMDVDMSGKLGMEEFKNLWINIRTWKNVFKAFDHDGSGHLNVMELRAALHSAGYRVNGHILQAMVLRYGKDGVMTFDDFLMCTVKLKTMIETFRDRDPHGLGRVTFSLEEWVEKTMYS